MIQPYTNARAREGHCDSLPICADDVLAAARRHEKYLHTVSPRDYRMRVFDDGSVYFLNTDIPDLQRLFSFNEIQTAASDFSLSPHRTLERHLFNMWA